MAPFPYALGRHVHHDPRSRTFPARKMSAPRSVRWDYLGPVLNQGDIGMCTGVAMAHCLNTEAFAASRPEGTFLTLEDAVALYSEATVIDGLDQPPYQPNDRGSTGLAVAKVAQKRGQIRSYTHAFGFAEFLGAIQLAPALIGTNWSTSMYSPDDNAVVRYEPSSVLGGHEYLAIGVSLEEKTVLCLNSWGDDWADRGRFKISFEDFDMLLRDQGDIVVPVR